MPGNVVEINGSKELRWYVGDSRMSELVKYLDFYGERLSGDDPQAEDRPSEEDKD